MVLWGVLSMLLCTRPAIHHKRRAVLRSEPCVRPLPRRGEPCVRPLRDGVVTYKEGEHKVHPYTEGEHKVHPYTEGEHKVHPYTRAKTSFAPTKATHALATRPNPQ